MVYKRQQNYYTAIAVEVRTHKKIKELADKRKMKMKDFVELYLQKIIEWEKKNDN
jgi:hypothetical protein